MKHTMPQNSFALKKDHKLVLQNNGKGRKSFLEDARLFSNIPETTHESHCFLLSNSLSPLPLSSFPFPPFKDEKGLPYSGLPASFLSHITNYSEEISSEFIQLLLFPSVHRGWCSKASKRAYSSHYLEPDIHLPSRRAACFTHNDTDRLALMG